MKIGLVGLPNVGKSTLFNALVKSRQADAQNFPFCTIEPNEGIVDVKDDRLEKIAKIINPERIVYANAKFVDIAGLVKGASTGAGLGNQFLAHIREVDAIALVTRFFENSEIIHTEGSTDPKRDEDIIISELILADLDTISKKEITLNKEARGGNKLAKELLAIIEKLKVDMDSGKLPQDILDEKEFELSKKLQLLTTKKIIKVANVSEDKVNEKIDDYVVVCAKLGEELLDLSEDEQQEFAVEAGMDKLISVGFDALNLETFFTSGPKEVRAWKVVRNSLAPVAAGRIHTDFQQKFIRAEVCSWRDYVELGGESKVKELGKMKTVGKDYVVQDGDICNFLHGA